MEKNKIDKNLKTKALEIINLLNKEYPKANTTLKYVNPLQLLISTILSAQCTDKRVNIVTQKLFKKYITVEDYANADLKELEEYVRSTGFYRNKAKNIKKSCQILIEKFNSQVPRKMEEMILLPGVARKTANIVLSNAYNVIEGIAVDTHVKRVSKRLGITDNKYPDKIEKDLMKIIPKRYWMQISDMLILHGRTICNARKPKCPKCVLNNLCSSAFTFN